MASTTNVKFTNSAGSVQPARRKSWRKLCQAEPRLRRLAWRAAVYRRGSRLISAWIHLSGQLAELTGQRATHPRLRTAAAVAVAADYLRDILEGRA